MKNANRPIHPIECEIIDDSGNYEGLTKREHFAAMAPECPDWYDSNESDFIKRYFNWRCFYADSILLSLESTK